MHRPVTKSDLSPAQSRLVELLQTLNFGRIENLHVRGGEPCFDPAPRVVQKLKLGSENGPRPESALGDFPLKQSTIEMLETIAHIGDGEVEAVDVRYGLPFAMEIGHPPESHGVRRG